MLQLCANISCPSSPHLYVLACPQPAFVSHGWSDPRTSSVFCFSSCKHFRIPRSGPDVCMACRLLVHYTVRTCFPAAWVSIEQIAVLFYICFSASSVLQFRDAVFQHRRSGTVFTPSKVRMLATIVMNVSGNCSSECVMPVFNYSWIGVGQDTVPQSLPPSARHRYPATGTGKPH